MSCRSSIFLFRCSLVNTNSRIPQFAVWLQVIHFIFGSSDWASAAARCPLEDAVIIYRGCGFERRPDRAAAQLDAVQAPAGLRRMRHRAGEARTPRTLREATTLPWPPLCCFFALGRDPAAVEDEALQTADAARTPRHAISKRGGVFRSRAPDGAAASRRGSVRRTPVCETTHLPPQ